MERKSAVSTEQEQPQPQSVELGDGRQVTQSLVGNHTRSDRDSVIRELGKNTWRRAVDQWSLGTRVCVSRVKMPKMLYSCKLLLYHCVK